MSKKILAGILAAASILSVTSAAYAADTDDTKTAAYDKTKPATYSVDTTVTYGDVTAEVPDASVFKAAYLNPYGATVKTKDGDGNVIAKNNSPVASGVFAVKNLDTEEGLAVNVKTKITKATGVVIKNPNTKAPFGWDVVSPNAGDGYNYLTDYDKLTLKDENKKAVKDPGVTEGDAYDDAIAAIDADQSTGGGVSTKQGKNVGMWLVGGIKATELDGSGGTKANLVSNKFGDTDGAKADWKYVEFDPKLECSGELMTIAKATGTPASPTAEVGYFMLGGQLSETAEKSIDEAKDKVTFTVAFKLSPVAPTT